MAGPLLCSNAPAMSEFGLPDEITFSPNNLEELKTKIMKQLSNPMPQSKYKEKIMNQYDWENIVDKYYKELIKRNIVSE